MTGNTPDFTLFADWLQTIGAVILDRTSEWEVLRYRSVDNKTGVIYRNKKGQPSYNVVARQHYTTFCAEYDPRLSERAKRLKNEAHRKLKMRLFERDGLRCVYCGEVFRFDQLTVEHFHAISRGGSNHEDNCGLSCEPCNVRVHNLPIVEKMRIRDKIICENTQEEQDGQI